MWVDLTESVSIFNIVNHNNKCKEVGVQRWSVFTSLKLVDIMSIKRNWLVVTWQALFVLELLQVFALPKALDLAKL